jgi:hypothetical protein
MVFLVPPLYIAIYIRHCPGLNAKNHTDLDLHYCFVQFVGDGIGLDPPDSLKSEPRITMSSAIPWSEPSTASLEFRAPLFLMQQGINIHAFHPFCSTIDDHHSPPNPTLPHSCGSGPQRPPPLRPCHRHLDRPQRFLGRSEFRTPAGQQATTPLPPLPTHPNQANCASYCPVDCQSRG